MIDAQGDAYPYIGGGLVISPTVVGGAVTWSLGTPSEGGNVAVQAGYVVGGQKGYSFREKKHFWEAGLVSPSVQIVGYRAWKPTRKK